MPAVQAGKAIIVHCVAFANPATGAVYLVMFESSDANWTKAWELGEQIMKNLVLDKDF